MTAAASTAHAEGDDLEVVSDTTYVVDGDAGLVRVSNALQIKNVKPDQRVSGGVRYFYFTGYGVPIPVRATNVTAMTASGTPLAVETRIVNEGEYVLAEVTFARNLRYGKVETVIVSYDVVGALPREDNQNRINPAIAAFDVIAWGDPGQTSVKVVIPDSYEVELNGDDMTRTWENGTNVYSSGPIEDPLGWYVFVTAQDEDRLTITDVKVDGAEFEVRGWPGDTEWASFADTTITEGLPVLEDLVGQEWPHEGRFRITESYSPYLYGYAGWYNAADEKIEIVEQLEADVMLHELAHAWFNNDHFADRWITEGLADAYADQAMVKLGEKPTPRDEVSTDDEAAIRLSDWDVPTGTAEEIEALETYGYGASRLVVGSIVEQLGEDGMRQVLAAIDNGEIPYLGEGTPETLTGGYADWRRFLDLVQERGADSTIEQLLRTWVVTDAEAKDLDARAAARTKYDALETAGGDWAVPEGIRRAMSSWHFDQATDDIADATGILTARDHLRETAEGLGLDVPTDIEDSYQGMLGANADFAPVQERIDDYEAAAAVIASTTATLAKPPSLLEQLGLRGKTPQADLDAARTAFEQGKLDEATQAAERAATTRNAAEEIGRRQATTAGEIAGGSVLGLGILVFALRRRKRRKAARRAVQAIAHPRSGETAIPDDVDVEAVAQPDPLDGQPVDVSVVAPPTVAPSPLADAPFVVPRQIDDDDLLAYADALEGVKTVPASVFAPPTGAPARVESAH